MTSDIDTGRVAFALAQATLSMLVASGVLDEDLVAAAARDIEDDGALSLSENEAAILANVIRACVTA